MRWLKTGLGRLLLCCASAPLPSIASAATEAPTVQALLAEQDAALVNGLARWHENAYAVPDDIALDSSLRDAAAQLARDHVARLKTLIPAWITEERAAANNPNLRGADLHQALYLRSLNEIAIASVESAGPALDEAWLKAALAPKACSTLPAAYFGRRIAMIQAAPADARPALLAAEKELLSRVGTTRQGLAARPAAAELMAADHAVTRLREGLPVAAAPMTPFLAAQVFARDRKPAKPDRWEQCARSQWWLQSQLADVKTDRTRALTVYRYSTMLDVNDFVPAGYKPKAASASRADGKPAYPAVASFFHVQGESTLQVNVDDQGKAFKTEVVAREMRVPGVRGNRPLAFEALLDDAALDYARQRSYPTGKAGKAEFVMEWNLDKGSDEAK
ncbi:hypothetical protein J2X16_004103 [Pelomonas aquatica]|uniref:TonB C-terminal domain-containing protein n=1 Tax=Pelomonas aquatica TaxID=431058 RepID=A0ABU1ZDM5_9BURK|nr:hypothetical protein [Pelomonas aquatica]MDR7298735.1 hypothetical protein [Pelomonas aquatica]